MPYCTLGACCSGDLMNDAEFAGAMVLGVGKGVIAFIVPAFVIGLAYGAATRAIAKGEAAGRRL